MCSFGINHALNRSIGSMNYKEIKYSIDLIEQLVIKNEKFEYDKNVFIKRIKELNAGLKLYDKS